MKIKGSIIEHKKIADKLKSQKQNESLRAKVQALLQHEACAEAKKGYLAEGRIAKLFANYTLKPKISWELVKKESADDFKVPGELKHLPSHKERTLH